MPVVISKQKRSTSKTATKTIAKTTTKKTVAKKKSKGLDLLRFDEKLLKRLSTEQPEIQYLIGVDEVGRGSCMGPVTAAAFCLNLKDKTSYKKECHDLNDSKKLTIKQRERLYEVLCGYSSHCIGEATREEVEQLNVYQASLLAAERSILGLCQHLGLMEPNMRTSETELPANVLILLDGKALIKNFPRKQQQAIVKGDGLSFCIAAASVIAKQHRDSYVMQLAKDFPGYQWETNMGYPTPAHKRAIKQLGITPHHRRTYKTVCQKILF